MNLRRLQVTYGFSPMGSRNDPPARCVAVQADCGKQDLEEGPVKGARPVSAPEFDDLFHRVEREVGQKPGFRHDVHHETCLGAFRLEAPSEFRVSKGGLIG